MLISVATRASKARRSAAAALLLVLCVCVGVLCAGQARADSSGSLVSMANSARASVGLAPLTVSADLAAVARAHAAQMAASGVLAHTPNLPSAVCCWSNLGENVGEASTTTLLQHAFMTSPEHRANILSTKYTQIGVGAAVDAKGVIWVSEIFRRPSANPPAPAPTAVAGPTPTSLPITTPTLPITTPTTQHLATQPPATSPTRTATPAHAESPATAAESTHRPVGATGDRATGDRASRDLPSGRLPLAQALRVASALDSLSAPAPDPVSGLLDFAAATATSTA